jgi:hypothetical protein
VGLCTSNNLGWADEELQNSRAGVDARCMRLVGWLIAALLGVGSALYAAAILVAVKFGRFVLFLIVADNRSTKTSTVSLYFEILLTECRWPLVMLCALLLWLGCTQARYGSKKSALRIAESFAVIEANQQTLDDQANLATDLAPKE